LSYLIQIAADSSWVSRISDDWD